jgi:prevent-host-death family protein
MKNLSTSEAHANFSDLVSRVAVDKERVILTQAGEEVVAIIPVEDLALMDALEERIDLEEARAALREAEEEGTIPLDVLKRELGF